MPGPGEPLFLEDDTAAVIALAEEERDTCPSCGMPKAWCRDPANQFGVFEHYEETCHVTRLLADQRATWKDWPQGQQAATQLSARFREGREPDIGAGLGLPDVEIE